ncbi:MAG: HIT family protein [Candidatus Woesearchaeota archaeon]
MGCIFCKIVKGEISCAKVYEDKSCIAFLDIGPATPQGGHTLVVPKKHFESIKEIPQEELNTVMAVVKKISSAMLKEADGVNIVQNNGEDAGQAVPHFHVHVMPRHKDDGVTVAKWAQHPYAEGEIGKVQQKITKLLNEP